MTQEEEFDDIMLLIRNTNLYLIDLTRKGDVDGLNLYRIFLNEKIMEAVRLKKKIKDGLKR
jgi:hypothetical protein